MRRRHARSRLFRGSKRLLRVPLCRRQSRIYPTIGARTRPSEPKILQKVPSPIVFDHLAHIPEPDGISHPLFAQVRALIDKGKTWVKLSGAYADTKVGPPTYSDSSAVARAYVKAAPERLVWGSDWPHPGVRDPEPKPDDAILIDLMLDWSADQAVRTASSSITQPSSTIFQRAKELSPGPSLSPRHASGCKGA
jgi:Amidohydrolase